MILQGDVLERLKDLPDESVNCVMTSPPYWALRDYGISGQLGLESTFKEYINKLCDIFDEVKRVLRKDGTCWINLGDTYASAGGSERKFDDQSKEFGFSEGTLKAQGRGRIKDYPHKSLCMIPFRFAIEMVNRGWILRNTIIWHKPNCMPSSAKDRFTVDFEYLFFFVKNKKYWFETQYDPHLTQESRPDGIVREREFGYDTKYPSVRGYKFNYRVRDVKRGYAEKSGQYKASPKEVEQYHGQQINYGSQGRNKRAVWKIPTQPFPEAHFAVYPEAICETPIKSGCPEFVCNKCGKAREKIMNPSEEYGELLKENKETGINQIDFFPRVDNKNLPEGRKSGFEKRVTADYKFSGYTNCNCNAGFHGGIVLDPFFGAGTTGVVALKQNKKFIGIEISPEYIEIAKKRLKPYLEQTKLFK